MFSNLSAPAHDSIFNCPHPDSRLPFTEYIKQCQTIISERREDLNDNPLRQTIIDANSPFEYLPTDKSNRYGVLLIHGLLDCPFTFRELGAHLQSQNILARAILLPGHGTRPSDLLQVTFNEWLQAVRYGVATLKNEVEKIYLVGYSTGAALAIHHAMQDESIAGIITLAPAVKLSIPIDYGASWHHLLNHFSKYRDWVYHLDEDDYTKYKSIAFNGVKQVTGLTHTIREMCATTQLRTPLFMILSKEDETISSEHAIAFFTAQHNPKNTMLLYTSDNSTYADSRIETRSGIFADLNISSIAHPSMTFSQDNFHYGPHGDYEYASHSNKPYIYGAYNRIQMNVFDMLASCGLTKKPRRVLTYNPDFQRLADNISQFIRRES